MIDLDPDKSAIITNENESISLIDIPKVANEGRVRYLDEREVAKRLKKREKTGKQSGW